MKKNKIVTFSLDPESVELLLKLKEQINKGKNRKIERIVGKSEIVSQMIKEMVRGGSVNFVSVDKKEIEEIRKIVNKWGVK